MSNRVRVAISGMSGCGNTTVSRMLSEKFNFKMVNYTFRNVSKEEGLGFSELCKMAETDPKWDYHVDRKQVELAMEGDSILGSRLAIWMLKEADLKVFLTASPEVRGARIQKREGGSLKERIRETEIRDKRDHDRYMKLYDIDNSQYGFADLIINTDRIEAQHIVDIISTCISRSLKEKGRSESISC